MKTGRDVYLREICCELQKKKLKKKKYFPTFVGKQIGLETNLLENIVVVNNNFIYTNRLFLCP